MKKWNVVIDVAKCTNCNMCTLVCHDEYVGNEFPGYAAEMPKHGHRWVNIHRKERGQVPMVDVAYLPTMCTHCDDAPCIKKAENGAITKRSDGIVLIDPIKAKGQKHLVQACPYGAIWWNEEKEIPQHWPFDAHLLDNGWTETRGSQACPTRAMITHHVEDSEMAEMVKAEGLEVLQPELGTKPRIYYKNMFRYAKAFIGGSLAAEIGGVVECVEGAKLKLMGGSGTIGETVSDNYGDFKFDDLDENSGTYKIEIDSDLFPDKVVEVELKESVYLGVLTP